MKETTKFGRYAKMVTLLSSGLESARTLKRTSLLIKRPSYLIEPNSKELFAHEKVE